MKDLIHLTSHALTQLNSITTQKKKTIHQMHTSTKLAQFQSDFNFSIFYNRIIFSLNTRKLQQQLKKKSS